MSSTIDLAIKIVSKSESCRLKSYPDPASELAQAVRKAGLKQMNYDQLPGWQKINGKPWTIGFGTTDWHGKPVEPLQQITIEDAVADRNAKLASLEAYIATLVRVPLTAEQMAALISLTYNIGRSAFKSSTVLRKLNQGDEAGASKAFMMWTRAGNDPDMLRSRREEERKLFDTP